MYISLFLYFKNNIVWLITTIDLLKMEQKVHLNVVCLIRVLCLLLKVEFSFLAVQQTTVCSKLITSQGRGRFFIRLMLMRRILGNVINTCCTQTGSLRLIDTQVMIETSFLHTINIIYFLHSGIALMLLFWEMRSLLVSVFVCLK